VKKISGEYPRTRVEYTKWDIWWGILYIILIILDVVFIIFGIVYHPAYEWFSLVFTWTITILTYFFIKKRHSPMRKILKYDEKTKNLYNSIEKKILHYLKSNPGNAYSSKALLSRIEENIKHPNFKKYIMKNGERILNNMISEGIIQETYYSETSHFFIPSD